MIGYGKTGIIHCFLTLILLTKNIDRIIIIINWVIVSVVALINGFCNHISYIYIL